LFHRAKRFSRLPAKYEITMPSKTSSASPDAEETPKTPKKGKAKATPKKGAASATKKRKMAEAEVEDEDVEEDVKAESDDQAALSPPVHHLQQWFQLEKLTS